MLYRFHVNLFAMPESLSVHDVTHRGFRLHQLLTSHGKPPTFDAFFGITFEQALDALSSQPRLDAEPDGFFLLNGEHEGRRWQIDGHLFDFADRLHRVELHGACPAETFDALLRCFGWPQTPVAFELVHEGVALDETAFRQWAAASS